MQRVPEEPTSPTARSRSRRWSTSIRQALAYGREALGVAPERCYTDAARAFAETQADFCTVAVTPEHHERIIDLALAHGLDILCEKPIADTMAASLRIARKVTAAGRKMAVTMSHRFDQDKTTLRRIVRSGMLGRINAIGMRFQGDMRQHMAWSSLFRHRMQDPAADRGRDPSSRHHRRPRRRALRDAVRVDMEAGVGRVRGRHRRRRDDDLRQRRARRRTKARCRTPVGLNTFYKEYIRVDGERGTAILNHRDVEVFMRQDIWRQQSREGQGQKVAAARRSRNGSTTG